MSKKPPEFPEPEKPTKLPPEEPREPSWPVKEPEIKPAVEPSIPFNPPKEIPPSPEGE
jgi:hypothetical protein